MAIEIQDKVKDVFSKYGFPELLGIEAGTLENALIRAVASEVEQRRNFSDFKANVQDHIWPYASNGDYRQILEEMSKDLH